MPVLRLGEDNGGVGVALSFTPTVVAVVVTTADNELIVVEGSANSGGLESPSGPGGNLGNGLLDLMGLGTVAIDGVGGNLGMGWDCWIFSLRAFLSFVDFDLSLLRKPSMLPGALTGVPVLSSDGGYRRGTPRERTCWQAATSLLIRHVGGALQGNEISALQLRGGSFR